MSLLFGPHTKLDKYEEEIVKILLEYNKSIYPVIDSGKTFLFEEDKIKLRDSRHYSIEDSDIGILQEGTLIPVDFLNIKTQEFYTKKVLEEYKNRFVYPPDFIFVNKDNEYIDLIPLDIKNGGTPFVDKNKTTNQISAYNLANILNLSPYLQDTVEYLLNKHKNSQIVIHNGFFLTVKKKSRSQTSKQLKLEEEIEKSLKKRNVKTPINIKQINKTKKKYKKFSGNKLFDTKQEYFINKISYEDFKNEINFIKNRIEEKGYFGSEVIAIGALKTGKKIMQFEYHPESFVKTYSPRKVKLNRRQEAFIEKEEKINYQIKLLDQKIEFIKASKPEYVYQKIFQKKEENIIEKLYNEGIGHLNERIFRIEQEENTLTKKINKLSKLRKTSSKNEKQILGKEMRQLEEKLNNSRKNYTDTKLEIEKEKEKIKMYYNSATNHKSESLEILEDVTKRYEKLMDRLEHHRPAEEKYVNHLLFEFTKLDNKIHRLENIVETYKEKICSYRKKIYEELKNTPWFSKKGLEVIENYKNEQIKEIMKEKKKLLIAKDNLLNILKHNNENEIIYVNQKHEERLQKDKHNTKKIKEFNKNTKYNISKNSIVESPLTLYINLDNKTVYKVNFYNTLDGNLSKLTTIEETHDKRQGLL